MKLLKKMAIVVIFCAVLTGIIFFIKDNHDDNIQNTYINYVNDTLIPKYGKSSLYLENNNNPSIEGEKLLDKDSEGILFYKIIDLDESSNQNLLVLRSNIKHDLEYEGSISTELIYDIYTIDDNKVKQIKFNKNKFYLLGDFLKNPQKNKTEYSLFTIKNQSQNYFCTNYISISNIKDNIYFNLKIFNSDKNNNSINLDYELSPEIDLSSDAKYNFRILQFDKDSDLIFKNKTDLKNKCISNTKKYGLDNLVKSIFDDAENKTFTDISKLNNIDKIISIKIK
ncbi:MAG: hypothetical protein ACI3VR_15425 [Intestinibacter sp.]|uniref:hypothetical protein n=1 Tax=Intestinibacter sp. TaxID=1965304 RepID=UPI003F140BF5